METPKLKCLLVDDSKIQRRVIGEMIKNHPSLVLTKQFSHAIRAGRFIQKQQVDVIFLDIEMPVMNGFDFLDKLENRPSIVFLSDNTQNAHKAFDYDAIDYLHKPVEKKRFEKTVSKVVALPRFKEVLDVEKGKFIFVKSRLKKYKIYLENIDYFEADGDYVNLITAEKTYPVLATLRSFAESLPKSDFVRVHKSYIVNLNKVKSYGTKQVELENKKIPLSRNQKAQFQENLLKKEHLVWQPLN